MLDKYGTETLTEEELIDDLHGALLYIEQNNNRWVQNAWYSEIDNSKLIEEEEWYWENRFGDDNISKSLRDVAMPECGTVCCLAGWMNLQRRDTNSIGATVDYVSMVREGPHKQIMGTLFNGIEYKDYGTSKETLHVMSKMSKAQLKKLLDTICDDPDMIDILSKAKEIVNEH